MDRLVARDGVRRRLTDSVETALRIADGLVLIDPVDDDVPARRYSEKRACPNDHILALEEIEPRTFSFNAPYGACPECTGIGVRLEVDPGLVVPDEDLSLAGAPSHRGLPRRRSTSGACSTRCPRTSGSPWTRHGASLPEAVKEAVLIGKDYEVHVKFRNRFGRERAYTTGFEGVISWIQRLHEQTESEWSREKYEAYMREVPCPVCKGTRLKPEVLAVTIGGRSIAEVSDLSIADARDFLLTAEAR
ncbi:hypothetical protein [Demequina litorisediminis]|uniref:hypothetical protein n=1 Tax=Demequina litorisediminis TaxID=1849022 RepID=UPI003D66C952